MKKKYQKYMSFIFICVLIVPLSLLAKVNKEPSEKEVYDKYSKYAVEELKKEFSVLFEQEFERRFEEKFSSKFKQEISNRAHGFLYVKRDAKDAKEEIKEGQSIPFQLEEKGINKKINCAGSILSIAQKGVYSVTVGIVETNQKFKFELQKKSKDDAFQTVPGGTLFCKNSDGIFSSSSNGFNNAVTLLINLNVGDELKVVNTNGIAFKLGNISENQVYAYIALHKIN